MDNKEQFRKEVDTYLDEITLTDEMKRNIRKACYEQKQKKVECHIFIDEPWQLQVHS